MMIIIIKTDLHDSDVRGNENPATSSIPYLAKKVNLDDNVQFKGYLEKLLDMPSIKSNIIRNDNKASADNSHQLSQPTYNNNNLHGLPTHNSSAKKPTLKNDDISISIGTIILNVTKVNNDSPRNQISGHRSLMIQAPADCIGTMVD